MDAVHDGPSVNRESPKIRTSADAIRHTQEDEKACRTQVLRTSPREGSASYCNFYDRIPGGVRPAPGQACTARSSRSGGDGAQNQSKQTPTTSRATPPARSAARSVITASGVTGSFMYLNAYWPQLFSAP